MATPEQEPLIPSDPPRKSDAGLFAGIALIVLGLLFLLVNVTSFRIRNWPAVLLLVPAVMLLAHVVTTVTREGGLYRSVRVSLIGGLVLLILGCLALFHLSLTLYWPLVLIGIGVGIALARRPAPGEPTA